MPEAHTYNASCGLCGGQCDIFANKVAEDGVDRCDCGCKYWENDRCIDCGDLHPDIDPTPPDPWTRAMWAKTAPKGGRPS